MPRLPHLLLTLALALPAAPALGGAAVLACPDRLPKAITAPALMSSRRRLDL